MSSYQMITFDMDGTLLNSHKEFSPYTLQMAAQAEKAGKIIVISTGRSLVEMRPYLAQLPFIRYLVASSGGMIYDLKTGRRLYSKTIPVDTALKVLDLSIPEDPMVQLLEDASYVQRDQEADMSRYFMSDYQATYDAITTMKDDIRAFYRAAPFPLAKLNLFHKSVESRLRTRKRLEGLALVLADSEVTVLECSPPGVDKGNGVQILCSLLGIDLSRVISVGDADNDLALLKRSGLPIAMGNANSHVKAVAKACVNDCDHDGCAQAITEYLL